MRIQELKTAAFLEHLRRHPMPELMDEECIAALSAVEKQYGDIITHGAGLEIRLGEEARYADFIMNIDEHTIPSAESLWYELDYADYLNAAECGSMISPCLFMTAAGIERGELLNKVLPPFLGEARIARLRGPLDFVMEKLPEGACVRQIGTMTARGELDIIRLVIRFPTWESVFPGLTSAGWQGDTAKLREAVEPWKNTSNIAVDLDLGEGGLLPKIGIEISLRWRDPILVDKFISRLEESGLCLKSKGEALRRWIRIRPDADPFIQTLISYYKLNYKDGKITAAKAYLEQSPYIHHHYFDAYERPAYMEIAVKDGGQTLPVKEALKWIRDCRSNRVHEVRFTGRTKEYGRLDRLLAECKESRIDAVVAVSGQITEEWIRKMTAAGAGGFLVDIGEEPVWDAFLNVSGALDRSGCPKIFARWFMHGENAGELPRMIRMAEKLRAEELVVTGMRPSAQYDLPSKEDLKFAAETIRAYSGTGTVPGMRLTVDSCFSPLRALLEGSDPVKNANRGIERGCTAGRDHFTVLPSGEAVPCVCLGPAEKADALDKYWTGSPALEKLREQSRTREVCGGCVYGRRCLPCPALEYIAENCPLKKENR